MKKRWLWMVLVVMLAAGVASAREYNWFIDTFDGTEFDPRWTYDNSPSNTEDANLAPYNYGNLQLVGGWARTDHCHQEAYNHLECAIDADLNFAVQVDSRVNSGMTYGGNRISVYWDPITYVSLHWGRGQYLDVSYSDGTNFYNPRSTTAYTDGWEIIRLRMEFLDDVIKCYAKREAGGPELVYYPVLDVPRGAVFKAQNALLIVGKGYQSPNDTNPDYDNEEGNVWGDTELLMMDNVIYEPMDTYQCGDPNTVYLDSDLNSDCDVNPDDLAVFVNSWLWCSNPTDADCDQFWKTQAYFVDEFDQVSLDPRWHEDNSPSNPAGSEFIIALGYARNDNNFQEAYHHLETPIETTGNFTAQAKVRCSSGMGPGAPHLVVYWDATHFVGLECGRGSNCAREYYNGAAFTSVNSTLYSEGWDFFNMQIEITADTLRFYLANYTHDNDGDPEVHSYEPVYHPELDMPRQSWMTGPALMIAGKGTGAFGGGLDFDNDAYPVYGADHLIIDSASYQPLDVEACGDPGTVFFTADMNRDCYVNLVDYADFAAQWLWCTDPERAECDPYW